MNKDTKEAFIDALMSRPGIYTKRVNDNEYRTRCPLCGDSKKNENTGHMYIKVNVNDNSPIQFHCFLCEEGGVLKPSMLSMLEIDDINLKSSLTILNKSADKIDKKGIIDGGTLKTFDYELPEIKRSDKTKYIENRLGIKLPDSAFKKMKVITSLREFLIHNKIKKLTCSDKIAYNIEKNYVGFLSYGNSHILFRDITEKQEISWFKYPITKDSSVNRIFYSMDAEIDLFTSDEIIINIAEGVMDIISAHYNLGYDGENVLNLCVSGRYYSSLILFLISMGFIGSNITINIFADNDYMFNNKNNVNTTTLGYYKKILSDYKHLFGKIYVWYNLKSKDIGVPRDMIELKRYNI